MGALGVCPFHLNLDSLMAQFRVACNPGEYSYRYSGGSDVASGEGEENT